MIAFINLLTNGKSLERFSLPYDQLTKSYIESYISSQFGLENGYQISYIDADGDQITVEFDDDYEVAKLTHEDEPLNLNVKVSDEEWIKMRQSNEERFDIKISEKVNSLLPETEKIEEKFQNLDQPKQSSENEQKVDPSLLEPLIEHPVIEQQVVDSINQPKPQEKIIIRPNELEETQTLIEKNLPTQYKRTETQTSELESVDEPSQTKAPKKKPTFDFIQDGVPFVQEQSENQKPQVLEPKITTKPKQKKIKEKAPKPSKKAKAFTEKDIKKLVKKEVFKLLPQIAQKLKSANQVNESSDPEIGLTLGSQTKLVSYDSSKCTVCSSALVIPFYMNSCEGIKMCEKCQETDDSTYPLVKIRNKSILQQIEWAKPLCYVSKGTKREQVGDAKFYTEVKKQFLDTIKSQFDEKIKTAKENCKKEKQQKKEKAKIEKIKKQKKEIKQESLI